MNTRTCKICEVEKPETPEFFYRDRAGFRGRCRSCYQTAEYRAFANRIMHRYNRTRRGRLISAKYAHDPDVIEYRRLRRLRLKGHSKLWRAVVPPERGWVRIPGVSATHTAKQLQAVFVRWVWSRAKSCRNAAEAIPVATTDRRRKSWSPARIGATR